MQIAGSCVIFLMLLVAPSWFRAPAPAESADRIVISKSHHRLTLYAHGVEIHRYSVALGRATGPKEFQGDHKTPEGHYLVDGKNPHSQFYRALHLSYPNSADRSHAAAAHRAAGGDVEIHGLPKAYAYLGALHRAADWTDGCIALTNAEMDEIYPLVAVGTAVDIEP